MNKVFLVLAGLSVLTCVEAMNKRKVDADAELGGLPNRVRLRTDLDKAVADLDNARQRLERDPHDTDLQVAVRLLLSKIRAFIYAGQPLP